MGQQQLLLIVLGVIVVGIAVVVGINLFSAGSVSSNRDAIVGDLTNLASSAQLFFRKPLPLGGGGLTFVGYTIPTQLATTANATYTAVTTATTVTFTGTSIPKGANGTSAGTVVMVVGQTSVGAPTFTNF